MFLGERLFVLIVIGLGLAHSRHVVVGTTDRRWDQFVLIRLPQATLAGPTYPTRQLEQPL